jgi:hypothetical protein
METAVQAPPVREPATARWVGASVIGLLALLLVSAGLAGVWGRYGSSERGWITSGTHRYAAPGRAIVSGSLDADAIPDWLVGKARVTASSGSDHRLFVGVARREDVDRYLAGVAHSTVEDVNFDPFDASYSSTAGKVAPGRPAAQSFWVESKTGTGTQTASWKIRNGHWRVVIMNADASPRVVADAKVGATISGGVAIAFSALGVGVALLAAAVALGASAARRT